MANRAGYGVTITGGDGGGGGGDLTASEVKTLYESNSDTNAFEDADVPVVRSARTLRARSVPVATATGFAESAIEEMTDDSVMISERVTVQSDMGIGIGPGVTMFDQGSQPAYMSGATGNRYTFILNQYLQQTGFVDPVFSLNIDDDTAPVLFPFQTVLTETITSPSFTLANTASRMLDELLFRAPDGVTNSNVCVRIRSTTNNNADVLYLPNERDWMRASEGDFTQDPGYTFTGSTGTDNTIDVSGSPVPTIDPAFAPVTYQFDFVSNGDLVLLGDTNDVPYLQARGHAFEFKPLTEHIDDRIAAQVTPPMQVEPSFASFTIDGITSTVADGFTTPTTLVFRWSVLNVDEVDGNLTILQNGTTITQAAAASGTASFPTVGQTINAGESITWTIRGTSDSGRMFSRTFTARAPAAHEFSYWGIRSANDFATVDTADLTAVDFTANTNFETSGTVGGGEFLGGLIPSDLDISRIELFGSNVIDRFVRTPDARTISGQSFHLYTLENQGSIAATAHYTFRRAS